ncbi:MAG: hypothetical protein KBB39_12265, partial [Phycicoccus sp.]|nr:hypothetical protein [Phycicoccus sp.]
MGTQARPDTAQSAVSDAVMNAAPEPAHRAFGSLAAGPDPSWSDRAGVTTGVVEAPPAGLSLFVACPDVAAVAGTDPFVLAGLMASLTPEVIGALTPDRAEVLVAATQRVINAVAARQAAAVDAFHGGIVTMLEEDLRPDPADPDDDPVVVVVQQAMDPTRVAASMLAPLLRVAPRTMVTRICRAIQVTNWLPRTHAMSWAGDLEPARVDAITIASMPVDPGLLVEFDARVHDTNITGLACGAVRARAVSAALRTDPDGVAARHAQGLRRRTVRVQPGQDPGMTRWVADLPTDTSTQMWAAIDTLACEFLTADTATGRHRDRTVSNARADALTALVLSNATVDTHITLILPITTTQPSPSGGQPLAAPASIGATGVGQPEPQPATETAPPGETLPERVHVWFDPDPIHLLAPDPPPPLDPDTWLFDLVHGVVTDTTAQASLL